MNSSWRTVATVAALVAVAGACSSGERLATSKSTSTLSAAGDRAATTTLASGTPSTTVASAAINANAVTLDKVAKGYDQPTSIVAAPDQAGVWIAERSGKVWELSSATGTRREVLDLSDRVETGYTEQGLLGLAVAPDRTYLVVDYVNTEGAHGTTIVARYPISSGDGGPVADADGEKVLLSVKQPFDNHNGGQLAFGPDGKLYVALGDGGSQGDPSGNGQNTAVPLAKILRIEPDTGKAVTDNPFVGRPGADDRIWLYGVRNPWRFSFDSAGAMWIADVGGSDFEEVDHLAAGQSKGVNLGWHLREGTEDTEVAGDRSKLVDPIATFSHDDGWCSIIGGFSDASGTGLPAGVYVFGDSCRGELWATGANGKAAALPKAKISGLTTFGTGPGRELYAANLDGDVYRVVGS